MSQRSNLSRDLHKAVKSLREDKNIVILPADKENATVVLDQSDYEAKMEDLLQDVAYKKVKRTLQAELRHRCPLP